MNKSIQILLISIIFMFCFNRNALAQCIISGYVSDSTSNERLVGATIYCPQTGTGTTTNAFGFFSIKTNHERPLHLTCSFVGYRTETYRFNLLCADTLVHLKLSPGKELEEITVTAHAGLKPDASMSSFSLPMKMVEKLPALGGEVDLIKAMQLLPGIKAGDEGTSGIYVRGSSPDQNLVMIDDVPLYHVNHLGGFVSIFNPDIINHVNLVKGSFPARYGSRLSSVIDVRMKDGNMKKHEGNATIGMVTCKISVEGPIKCDTSSYIVSVRRFMYDF